MKSIPEEMIVDLAGRFPGRPIIRIPEKDPTEVIVEIFRAEDGSLSLAVALILESKAHKHYKTKEFYAVTRGKINIFLGDPQSMTPYPIDAQNPRQNHITLQPPLAHKAIAEEPAEVAVMSVPAWTPADHILIEEKPFFATTG